MEDQPALPRPTPTLLLLLLLALGLAPAGLGQTQDKAMAANATLTPAPPAQPQPVAQPAGTWTEPKTGMVFNWVPAGCFVMGSPATEPGRNLDEGPQHEVCLSGFWIGQTEVTQGQWRSILGDNPSLIESGDSYPVDMISWYMARDYAARLGKTSGETFRLPTEAEWEYAARAGTTTAYAFGDGISQDQASFGKRYQLPAPRSSRRGSHRKAAQPKIRIRPNMHTNVAASFQPNGFGLYDMHGNVWEWCQDVYDAQYYARSPRLDPLNTGEGASRILRGGSWVTKAATLRSANRSRAWPDLRTAFYGLRLVRIKEEPRDDGPARISQR